MSPRAAPALARICRPAAAQLVARERLFAALDRAREQAALWLCAPGGAGKTSLVSSYVEARAVPCAWYQADLRDADPATFFHFLALAAKRASPRSRRALPALTPQYLLGVPAFTRTFFEALFARLPRGALVVLDNLEEMPVALIEQVLRDALAVVSQGCSVFAISRGEPPPALARSFANGTLTTLGWDALRLTAAEACAIAARRGRTGPGGLNPQQVGELNERAEGWIAGLVLLLERTDPAAPGPRAGDGGRSGKVFDYLAAEVLDKVDPETRRFLLETSLLARVDARGAERLTGNPRAARILEDLRRRQLFVNAGQSRATVYQYHGLFRDFLRTRAAAVYPKAALARLRRRAAALVLAEGDSEEAASLLQGAGHWTALADLVCRQAPELLAQGRNLTVLGWIESLPTALRRTQPWMLFWEASARLPYDPLQAREGLERAFERFGKERDAAGRLLAWCGIVDSFFLAWDDFSALGPWIEWFDAAVGHDPQFPDPLLDARVTSSLFNALVNHQPYHPALPVWRERLARLLGTPTDDTQRVLMGTPLLIYQIWMGDTVAARRTVALLRPGARAGGHTNRPLWHGMRALQLWADAEFPAAFAAVDESLALADATGVHIWDCAALAQGGYAALGAGDLDRARGYLARMEAAVDARRRQDFAQYHFLRSREAALRGESLRALEHAETALDTVATLGTPFPIATARLGLAQALLELGRYPEARAEVDAACETGRAMGSRLLEYQCWLSRTRIALGRERRTDGVRCLRRTLALAREMSLRNHALWHAPAMAELCALALREGIETDYVRGLIRARGLAPADPPLEIAGWPWQLRVYTLGRFAVVRDGEPLRFASKARRRPLELLEALIARGGREVGEARLTATLWPDADGDAAHRSFTTTLHRLRRLLGDERCLRLRDARLTLDASRCWVDAWAFERLLGAARETLAAGDLEAAWEITERAMGLYQGPFLDGVAWGQAAREHLERRCLEHLRAMMSGIRAARQCERAYALLQRALEVQPLAEEFYRELMECYRCEGRVAEGLAVYQRCREALAAGAGVEPSAQTRAAMVALRQ